MFSADRLRELGNNKFQRESHSNNNNSTFEVPIGSISKWPVVTEDTARSGGSGGGNSNKSAERKLKVLERIQNKNNRPAAELDGGGGGAAQSRLAFHQQSGNASFENSTSRINNNTSNLSNYYNGKAHDAPATSSSSTWTRAALEQRIRTLENMLAEGTTTPSAIPFSSSLLGDSSSSSMPLRENVAINTGSSSSNNNNHHHQPMPIPYTADVELSEHLQVTVRKNRALTAELEVTKNALANMVAEKEKLIENLKKNQALVEKANEEMTRAKDALAASLQKLALEKRELVESNARLEEENAMLKHKVMHLNKQSEDDFLVLDPTTISGSLSDVKIINDALKESLRRIKNTAKIEE